MNLVALVVASGWESRCSLHMYCITDEDKLHDDEDKLLPQHNHAAIVHKMSNFHLWKEYCMIIISDRRLVCQGIHKLKPNNDSPCDMHDQLNHK